MASTKILNISKSDTFEEVFGLVQDATAEEVILIIPKGSKLAKQEAHFTVLKKEADNSGKVISVMTEDPKVESLAKLCGLQLLANPSTTKSKIKNQQRFRSIGIESNDSADRNLRRAKSKIGNLPESYPQEVLEPTPLLQEEEIYAETTEDYPDVALAAVPTRTSRRTMEDVIKEESETTIPIKEDKKTFKVGIKREEISTAKPIDQIEAIWANQKSEEYHNKIENKTKSPVLSGIFKRRNTSPHKRFRKLPALAIGLALVIFAVVAYVTMGSAQVIIQAKKSNVDFKLNVVTSPSFYNVDVASGQIPGQQFSIQKDVSDTFPATGQKTVAQKAHGRIQIFNNNIGKPQRLVATTRFESQTGLIFRIPVTITVPSATKTTDGKVAPGTIESDVYADKPGSEYNIDPSSFTIPGFKDLPQYTQFSALSTAAMTGGIIGPSKVVTEDDYAKAQQSLEQKLRDLVAAGLKDKILDLKVIGEDKIQIDRPVTNAKAGEAAEELKMTIHGSIDTVAFREADLVALIDNYAKANGGFDQSRSQLTKDYSNEAYDTANAKLSFTVHVSGTGAAKIDQDKITSDILGMSQDAIKSYFNNISEVSSVRIVLSPFWVTSIPKDQKKVKLTVE